MRCSFKGCETPEQYDPNSNIFHLGLIEKVPRDSRFYTFCGTKATHKFLFDGKLEAENEQTEAFLLLENDTSLLVPWGADADAILTRFIEQNGIHDDIHLIKSSFLTQRCIGNNTWILEEAP